jgi:hypothetical protein
VRATQRARAVHRPTGSRSGSGRPPRAERSPLAPSSPPPGDDHRISIPAYAIKQQSGVRKNEMLLILKMMLAL